MLIHNYTKRKPNFRNFSDAIKKWIELTLNIPKFSCYDIYYIIYILSLYINHFIASEDAFWAKCWMLRVVDPFHFLKPMSEKVGSDIGRFWIWFNRFWVDGILSNSSKSRVVLCRIRLFPPLISKIKWLWSELPLEYRTKWSVELVLFTVFPSERCLTRGK